MGFVNEVVSDEDIDRYGLPFRKGSGRYWTRDAESDYYLWGGLGGDPESGEENLGRFTLYIQGKTFRIGITPGEGSMNYSEDPFIVKWKSIKYINPALHTQNDRMIILNILKNALSVYGEDGRKNHHAKNLIVETEF